MALVSARRPLIQELDSPAHPLVLGIKRITVTFLAAVMNYAAKNHLRKLPGLTWQEGLGSRNLEGLIT